MKRLLFFVVLMVVPSLAFAQGTQFLELDTSGAIQIVGVSSVGAFITTNHTAWTFRLVEPDGTDTSITMGTGTANNQCTVETHALHCHVTLDQVGNHLLSWVSAANGVIAGWTVLHGNEPPGLDCWRDGDCPTLADIQQSAEDALAAFGALSYAQQLQFIQVALGVDSELCTDLAMTCAAINADTGTRGTGTFDPTTDSQEAISIKAAAIEVDTQDLQGDIPANFAALNISAGGTIALVSAGVTRSYFIGPFMTAAGALVTTGTPACTARSNTTTTYSGTGLTESAVDARGISLVEMDAAVSTGKTNVLMVCTLSTAQDITLDFLMQ